MIYNNILETLGDTPMVKNNHEKYFMPDQFSNEFNKLAHYETTAQEIWQETGEKYLSTKMFEG